ncbi:MAG TPA: pyridoxamine 5'-phosphate oxidase family protein [Thermomicrobiales bacterium]|nr:pyridoxamine 5'-phosphate oxidase family protein [Thermomicrobiales bacterium]
MVTTTAYELVTSIEQLREIIVEPPSDSIVIRKQIAMLDEHCRTIINASPFVLLSTANADGQCDVTPRGDGPGFVHILDERTLVVPDRPGNRRIDSMRNIIDNPHAGLLFLVPGMDETLRVNGRALLTNDRDLLGQMAVKGKTPQLGIIVEVEEVFFHCARAFRRAKLWEADTWPDRETLPTLGQIIADQTKPEGFTSEDLDRSLAESNVRLY